MKFLLIVVLLINIIKCKNTNESVTIEKDISIEKVSTLDVKTECDTLGKITTLILSAIDIPYIQQYYSIQKTISQQDFIITKNSFLNGEMFLSKFGRRVKLLSEDEIKTQKYQAYIIFEKLSIQSDTAELFFEYPIQGLGCEAVFVYSYVINDINQWKLLRYKLFEFK